MAQHFGIIQISHPGPTDESQYDSYWTDGLGSQLRSMYGALLGMVPIYIGYHKLVHEDGRIPEIGFEYSPDDVRPRWPDPAYPQQVHLDIEVAHLETSEQLVLAHGAQRLATFEDHRVFQDPAGHPFCLYPDSPETKHGQIARIVFDCFSPRRSPRSTNSSSTCGGASSTRWIGSRSRAEATVWRSRSNTRRACPHSGRTRHDRTNFTLML